MTMPLCKTASPVVRSGSLWQEPGGSADACGGWGLSQPCGSLAQSALRV